MSEPREMEKPRLRVLHIEDNPMDAAFVAKHLEARPEIQLEHIDRFENGLKRVEEGETDMILLDLNLPDSPGGLETFVRARNTVPLEIPIVVLTSLDDEEVGRNAVKKGAQDYLTKGKVDGQMLVSAMQYAMERNAEEGFFRAIVFSSPCATAVVDWRGRVLFVNDSAEKLFGKKAEEWVGRFFGHPLDPDKPQKVEVEEAGKVHLSVAETEYRGEVLYIVHAKRAEETNA